LVDRNVHIILEYRRGSPTISTHLCFGIFPILRSKNELEKAEELKFEFGEDGDFVTAFIKRSILALQQKNMSFSH
jgi:hypothetical protein